MAVTAEGIKYADMLKMLKDKVKPEDIGEILSIRKGPKEEVTY